MAKKKKKVESPFPLKPGFVKNVAAPGRYPDGGNLYLQVRSETAKSWLLRYNRSGRDHFMGLGPIRNWTLQEAREKARRARQALDEGIDPLERRRAEREEADRENAERITFREAAEEYLASHEDTWRNAKHRQQWRNTLAVHVYPTLGGRAVKNIDAALINETVAPIWLKIPETAARTKNRVETVSAGSGKAGRCRYRRPPRPNTTRRWTTKTFLNLWRRCVLTKASAHGLWSS